MQIRIAPSLGSFQEHPDTIWGTREVTFEPHCCGANDYDPEAPMLFFGLYGLPDFYKMWRHKGEKYILWCGTDITHFLNGYWLNDKGDIRLTTTPFVLWTVQNCKSFVENEVEQKALAAHGILSTVVPSFLGKVEDFPISFKPEAKIRLYTSVSGNDFKLYGWDKIPKLAYENPDVEFHLYGNTVEVNAPYGNIVVHGRVPKEQMNAEIKSMTGALRLTEFDGFSEILAKSILMGQYPVSLIPYPYMLQPHEIKTLKYKEGANHVGRYHYLHALNKYPWNLK